MGRVGAGTVVGYVAIFPDRRPEPRLFERVLVSMRTEQMATAALVVIFTTGLLFTTNLVSLKWRARAISAISLSSSALLVPKF